MRRLRVLNIRGTPLTGSLPPEWSRMSRLEYVGLQGTNINPAIPSVWGMLSSLQEVRLGNQRVAGDGLRQMYLRDMLRAHASRQTRDASVCRDGYVSYLYHCSGTGAETSVEEISE